MKIDFEFETMYGVFRDAITLPDDHDLTDQQIEEMKTQRLNNWLAIVNSPPSETPQETPQPPPQTLTIAGESYTLLEGTPPSGAKLIEVNNNWYVKD